MENWDPLDLQGTATSEILAAARKREIRNILKSYVGFFDPFCELLQNALDAVDLREFELAEPDYQKKIVIEIDLKANSLAITDNGIGFSEDQFRTFLTPSISFKNIKDRTRGNKGVGATYLAYGFNDLTMATKTDSFTTCTRIANGRAWVDDDEAKLQRPVVKLEAQAMHSFTNIDRGSTFKLNFTGNVRPRSLDWIGAETATQWKVLLLVKTPLGQILQSEAASYAKFDIHVTDKEGHVTSLVDQECRYVFPHTVIKACQQVRSVLAEQQKLIGAGKDPSKLQAKFKKLNGIYDIWPPTELQSFTKQFDSAELKLLGDYEVWAYGFFCYSAPKVLDQFNDFDAGLRKGLRIIRGGLQLATNAMPQGELITIPLTSNIGYQNQAHIIVHLTNADPDLGRKGFQPELQKLAERIAVVLVNRLKAWRHLLLHDDGPGGSHQDELDLDDWIVAQRDYEKSHPIILSNKNFFVPVNEISITAQPRSEQDVVALFNQLVAGGVIRGIKVMATSGHKQYDGLYRYHIAPPLINHSFDKETNPLGVTNHSPQSGMTTKPYVLEFKHNFDQLIQDFETEEKSEGAIDLAIVWELCERYKERYEVVPLLVPDFTHLREFHGLTHQLLDGNAGTKRMDLLVLSDLISFLNDSSSEIARQLKLYQSEE